MGWIVAQPAFITKLTYTTDGTTSNPSGFAEAAVSQVVLREWGGAKGFVRWIAGLRAHYKTRRDAFCEALAVGRDWSGSLEEREGSEGTEGGKSVSKKRKRGSNHDGHVSPTRRFDFEVPAGGMYVWVKLHLEGHGLAARPSNLSTKQIVLRLWNYLLTKYSLITIPGYVFNATPQAKTADSNIRLTFAATSPEQLRVAARAFVKGVNEFWDGEGWDLPDLGKVKDAVNIEDGRFEDSKEEDIILRELYMHHAQRSKRVRLL